MSDALAWDVADGCLSLRGELAHQTLLPLWQQRESLMQTVQQVDVSRLGHVDTSGLALLLHLRQLGSQREVAVQFTGISDKLRSLIGLYNLQQLLVPAA